VDALGANTDAIEVGPAAPEDTGGYWCRIDFEGTPYDSNTATLEVADHLLMTGAPQGGRKYVGDAHVFAVALSGGFAPLNYEWRKGADIAGTEPLLSLPFLTLEDAGWYHVTVSDDLADEVSTSPVGLEVARRIAILSGPANTRRYEGEAVSFAIQASGGFVPLTCTWYSAAGQLGEGFSMDLPALTESDTGSYWATVRDSFADRASSNTMTLEVRPHLRITGHPQGATKNEGDGHAFAVAVEGGFEPYVYTWRQNDIPVGASSTLVLDDLTPASAGRYVVEVADDNGDIVVSDAADLEVLASPLPALLGYGLTLLGLALVLTGRAAQRRRK
jgi:hypothetical protein